MSRPAEPLRSRFEANVCRTPTCWLWTGTRQRNGYGVLKVYGEGMLKAHRVAWELFRGPIPAGRGYHGTMVLHSCDNPQCVNPAHLRLGTAADNARDRADRNRGNNPRGAKHGMAALTAEQAKAIKADDRKQRVIAAEHGISRAHVSAIQTGKKWSHL